MIEKSLITPTKQVPSKDEVLARYERAQYLNQGKHNKSVARNTTLFPVWIDDSNSFWYERELKDGKEFRLVDAEYSTNKILFDHQALADTLAKTSENAVDPGNLPINNLKANPAFNMKVTLNPLTIIFSAFEKRWIYNTAENALSEVEQIPGNWVISPDGSQAAFRKDYNIWVRDLKTCEERRLTTDGESFYQYGVPGSVWGNEGFVSVLPLQARWSPDSKHLFTLQMDQRQVKTVGEIQHVPLNGSLRPKTIHRKLALPGDTQIENYRLLVIDIESAHSQEANYRRIPTTMGACGGFFDNSLGWWGADSRLAYFIDVDRYYKFARVVKFDVLTGNTTILFEETSKTRIDLILHPLGDAQLLPLPETRELLWLSERSGWMHCYLYNLKNGELKNAVTTGEWRVREAIHFDAKRRELFLSTSGRVNGRDPYYCDLIRVNIDTGEFKVLAASDHEYVVISPRGFAQSYKGYAGLPCGVSPTSDYAVVTRSRIDEVTESYLLDRHGKQILSLEVAKLSPPEGWQWPEPVTMKAADGKTNIYGAIYRPSDFCFEKSYPVIDHCLIGHPKNNVAKSSFRSSAELSFYEAASFAELGFIVVQIDGRGGLFRNKAFENMSYAWKDCGCNIDDHVAGLQQLAERYPYMDLDRVGIVGLLGGNGAILGLLRHPNFYKVGIAGEIFDNRVTGTNMGDLYEGPEPSPKSQHLEDLVDNLKGKLLIMVGLLDYVPPAASFRIVEALNRANKNFDLVVEPCWGYAATPYQLRRAWDYLVYHLQENEPPEDFCLNPLPRPLL